MKAIISLSIFWSMNSVCSAFTIFSSSLYQGRPDNPFLTIIDLGVVFVEDFETQNSGTRPNSELTTPYASAWNGGTVGSISWGVQEDYALGDPDGEIGYVWTNSFSTGGGISRRMESTLTSR